MSLLWKALLTIFITAELIPAKLQPLRVHGLGVALECDRLFDFRAIKVELFSLWGQTLLPKES
jgi:hypothetical protein